MSEEGYDVAQICVNGHEINSSSVRYPQYNKNFCDKCGAETITKCRQCGENIKGYYHGSGFISLASYQIPSFCDNCGEPYPWTKRRIAAAQDLAREVESLSKEDRSILEQSIDDIVKDSPNSPAAAMRFKKVMVKAGKTAADMFKDILVSVASEAAKKVIWG